MKITRKLLFIFVFLPVFFLGALFTINANASYDWTGSSDFSPDNKKSAYKARLGSEWFVVTETWKGQQKKGKSYSEIESIIWNLDDPAVRFIVFGPNGTLAYNARQNDKWYIVKNDKESPPYDWARPIIFSRDGLKMAYKARLGKDYFVVVNDKNGKSYDWVGFPIFSPDSKQFAYKARLGKDYFVVVNDKNGKSYDQIISISPNSDYGDFDMFTFTPDSKVEYAAKRRDEWVVVNGEKEISLYNPDTSIKIQTNVSNNPSIKNNILERKIGQPLIMSVILAFEKTNSTMRSLASRTETRLDKLAEKEAREDSGLRDLLVDIRLDIHFSEENVKNTQNILQKSPDDIKMTKESLHLAKQYLISAHRKFKNLINEIKKR